MNKKNLRKMKKNLFNLLYLKLLIALLFLLFRFSFFSPRKVVIGIIKQHGHCVVVCIPFTCLMFRIIERMGIEMKEERTKRKGDTEIFSSNIHISNYIVAYF